MAKSMTKSQIADYLAGKAGITKKGAVQILDDLAALAYREAKNVFTVPGIGKLKLANRKARIGRNPQTGEEIKIPAKRVVKFRVAKAAKDAILGKKKGESHPAYSHRLIHVGLDFSAAVGTYKRGRDSIEVSPPLSCVRISRGATGQVRYPPSHRVRSDESRHHPERASPRWRSSY